MFYKNYLYFLIFILLSNCTSENLKKNKPNLIFKENFTNKGFALVFTDNLYSEKIVSNILDERSLTIFQKNLTRNTQVKITNILNGKALIAKVGKKTKYPLFNNSVLSQRIARELELDINEPYIEIVAITKNSLFVANRAKTFNEEKNVANKVPVNSISVNDLNIVKKVNKENIDRKFSYTVKIAEFYYKKTAMSMLERIINETNIKNPKIKKISNNKYRVYMGPFKNINSLQKSYNDINILSFENIEFIKND